MKTIIRRLRRLEDQFCPPVETAFLRHLRERLEAARQRLAECGVPGDCARDADVREREDVSGLSVEHILHRGRARLATE